MGQRSLVRYYVRRGDVTSSPKGSKKPSEGLLSRFGARDKTREKRVIILAMWYPLNSIYELTVEYLVFKSTESNTSERDNTPAR